MKTVNSTIRDSFILHQTYLERLKTSQVNKLVGILNRDVFPSIDADIKSSSGKSDTKRLSYLRDSLSELVDSNFKILSNKAVSSMGDVALLESSASLKLIKKAMPISIDMLAPSPVTLRSLVTTKPFEGKLLEDWFDSLSSTTKNRLQSAINTGVIRGESVVDIIRRVGPVKDLTRSNVEAIVRTSVSNITSAAREITYEENTDVIDQEQWHSTLDTRTTNTCKALDGKVFPIGKGPRPPAHFNCRSVMVPVLKSWKDLGIKGLKELKPSTRASMDGQVPDNLTYNDWLKDQPRSIQDEALGPERAEMFRNGVDVERFVDNKYQPLTIEEIKKREGIEDNITTTNVSFSGKRSEELTSQFKPFIDKISEIKSIIDKRIDSLNEQDLSSSEMRKAEKALDKQYQDWESKKQELRSQLQKAMKLDRSDRSSYDVNINDKALNSAAKEATSWLGSMVNKSVVNNLDPITIAISDKDRSYAVPEMSLINVFKYKKESNSVADTIHEIGHLIEESNPEVKRKVSSFLQKRAKESGSKILPLTKLDYVGSYDSREKAWKDEFIHPYMGKFYKSGATEILSCGLEYLYSKPEELLMKDPDMFNFLIDLIQ